MFRHVGSTSGRAAAAGVAAAAGGAASTSTAQCRAETVTTPTSGAEARAKTPSHPTPSNAWGSVPDDWVDAAAVAISDADVAEAVQSVLHVVSPPSDAPPASSVSVRELGATSDEEGTPAGVASPTAAMAAADAQLALLQTNAAVRADFESALTSLLSNSEVRTACARALAADPAFAGLLRTVGAQADLPVDSFLPLAARVAARLPAAAVTGSPGGPADPLAAFFDALADGLVCLGKDISGVAGAVGKIAIDAGYRIHRLVSAPFGSTPHYLAGPDGGSSHRPRRPCADAPLGSPEFWKDVLTTVACVVVSVLLVKRLPRGRPAV